ncbi:phage head closure protein [Antarcticimicrobium sediminis]|uniref:Head-tail adaptor protein n=1 Tax=Antarcticimicrobium sediminis TaxID=2546227 RepID=A0A4R5EYW8_9RHOB|nr:phage head closure protein [Antarcticimicrobium sediminis]TDE40318.1 head-tail adaptor protein [Antarcticimicrobium sediminis]
MSAPVLARQLLLETPVRLPDGAGGVIESWTPIGALWAEVRPRTGRERAEAGTPVSTMGYRIVVRGAPVGSVQRPTPEQRFRDGARLYRIRAVAERDPAGQFLICFADEEVAA